MFRARNFVNTQYYYYYRKKVVNRSNALIRQRLLMTEKEKVQVQGRKVSAAALAHKRANPPEATRPLSKRVRVA